MIVYSGIGPFDEIIGSMKPIYISLVITSLIVATNVFTVFKMNYIKLKTKCKKNKKKPKQKMSVKTEVNNETQAVATEISEQITTNSPEIVNMTEKRSLHHV